MDNELDMELDDEEEMDGFTEDRWGYATFNRPCFPSILNLFCSIFIFEDFGWLRPN